METKERMLLMSMATNLMAHKLPSLASFDQELIVIELPPFADAARMRDILTHAADSGYDAYQERMEDAGDADSEDFYNGVAYALDQDGIDFKVEPESDWFAWIWSIAADESDPSGWAIRVYADPRGESMSLQDALDAIRDDYVDVEELC